MSILIEEVLDAWREAERLLGETPVGPDHETLEMTLAGLKTLYAELTATSDVTAQMVARGTDVVRVSRDVLAEANRRLARGG